ncbi:MAG: ANTAR domain-containing protein [Spirochaetia bacterium]|jgi:response regulator NasT|nr:ANTAR domain-containing protein [Spirochaetia bacterium]
MVDLSRILIVSPTGKGQMTFRTLLQESGVHADMSSCFSCNEARRAIQEVDFDLVLINAPLPDESGIDFALTVTEQTLSSVLLIIEENQVPPVMQKVQQGGVLVIGKPIIKSIFFQSITLAATLRQRLAGMKKENSKLRNKLEEIKLVDKAKCTLVQYLGLDEERAHHYVEKMAMDQRRNKSEIAKAILKTYQH